MATNVETVTGQGANVAAEQSADRIPLPRILGYGIGDFGFNFYWFSLQLFLAYYYTDVLGLRAEVAGLIIFVCLTWDGIVDPAIGVLANRTRSRWGKYRPFLLFGSIPLAAVAATTAVLLVAMAIAGYAIRAPLSRVPENSLKLVVGVMLTAFGIFWGAEGAGAHWPGDDIALLVLIPVVALYALALVAMFRRHEPVSTGADIGAA